jgi:hypothetical protein
MVFQPGVSGNPSGRPKGQSEFRELMRQSLPAERLIGALDALIAAGDPKATIYAIDQQLGKPAQSITVSGDPERPLHALIGVVARDLQPLAPAPTALPGPQEAHCLDDLDGDGA